MASKIGLLRLYFVTWNVATKYPEQDLHQLLGISHNGNQSLPDFYFVGLQEVKAQPQNMVLDMFFDDPWTKAFKEVLKEHGYVKIRTQRLQGLVLNFFCLRKHITHLRLIETQYTKTGFAGMWGNKGAVGMRLNIYGVSVCVVNCHLTPHDHLLADRVSDYNTILREHTFSVPDTTNIFYHDFVFWIGDLNFRLNGQSLTSMSIDTLVKKNQLDFLLASDQLKAVRDSGEAFAELNENNITFPPTYKYEFASQEFDMKRRPSWTDRILYKVNSDVYEDIKLEATQRSYSSHSSYVQSDHKPVSGQFDITVRSHIEDHGVEFQPVTAWWIDDENSISYKLLGNVSSSGEDWVGLFTDGFSSLDDYLVYEYVGRGKPSAGDQPNALSERMYFSDSTLQAQEMYRLVYVSQRDDIIGILGMSPPFPGHKRLA
ncbi:inositol polyphosphate 5-phosphatase K [Orussus abietinus]|uniref:inositol polyphosphate 5-phosphatase K n=1 Tax=Orussus abietinus TaxID=222816 RepID=UPI000625390F|nr:inositol polyphosphate 5-phosphatase K [Orussus abietinus]